MWKKQVNIPLFIWPSNFLLHSSDDQCSRYSKSASVRNLFVWIVFVLTVTISEACATPRIAWSHMTRVWCPAVFSLLRRANVSRVTSAGSDMTGDTFYSVWKIQGGPLANGHWILEEANIQSNLPIRPLLFSDQSLQTTIPIPPMHFSMQNVPCKTTSL